jgi:hypothetical protein
VIILPALALLYVLDQKSLLTEEGIDAASGSSDPDDAAPAGVGS